MVGVIEFYSEFQRLFSENTMSSACTVKSQQNHSKCDNTVLYYLSFFIQHFEANGILSIGCEKIARYFNG